MKRSMDQRLPSQEASSKMTRHNPEDVEASPTTNIFLVEPILQRLFMLIKPVSKLKDMRGMCQLWDSLVTKELEERAFQGQIKPVDLTFDFFNENSPGCKSLKALRSEMTRFLEDTSKNPRLFRSFALTFPGSLSILNREPFSNFYKKYSPTFLELSIHAYSDSFNQNTEDLLKELFRWAAPTLRELIIQNTNLPYILGSIPNPKSLPDQHFNFPLLKKLIIGRYPSNGISESLQVFEVLFTKGNQPEIPSLTHLSLRYSGFVDTLGLNINPSRWANLTNLDILCNTSSLTNDEQMCRFTNGLVSLAQAGMVLKKFGLSLCHRKDPSERDRKTPHFLETCSNLSQFFESQASSLEVLNFKCMMDVSFTKAQEDQAKILLPVFERLHALSLDVFCLHISRTATIYNIFKFESISNNFPALENLNIFKLDDTLIKFFEASDEEERMNLKRIYIEQIQGGNKKCLNLDKYFGFVEAFACTNTNLVCSDFGMLGDLVDTIRVLHIRDVTSTLNLPQFKGLRKVIIEEDDKADKTKKRKRKLDEQKGQYLSYFKEIAKLKLDSIMFRGLEMTEEENQEFVRAFPFRVEFEKKPMDWSNEDFMKN